ncbi:MAG: FeoB-associated Cys-rich membrane protein [Clostridia bacterium]|nr:FeoB-associated Cys-rich membrane protein [Clostridia bacterium]
MMTLYGENGKTWAEMTPEEQKVSLIVMGIMVLGIIAYGIYYLFKNKKDKKE